MNKKAVLATVILLTLFFATGFAFYITRDSETPEVQDEEQNAETTIEEEETAEAIEKEESISEISYQIVDTGQTKCYDLDDEVSCDKASHPGQDGSFNRTPQSYTNNNDGTVTDNNTNLIWQQSADLNNDGSIDSGDKKTQAEAIEYCSNLELAETNDWKLPSIKTLYSLMNFSGTDPVGMTDQNAIPFIDTNYFDFGYGDTSAGERQIDSQWATSTIYVSTVMNNQEAMFGLNLADGRIKGYPTSGKEYYVKCVRGNEIYGENSFTDNGNETVFDQATGLTWQKADSQEPANWEDALSSCNNATTGGYEDWRLPNAKELHSIVDYLRSPDTTNSPAINEIFESTSIQNENTQKDWGFYWTSTTHKKSNGNGGSAVYVSFGRALGYMTDPRGNNGQWLDVHGAGAQRSDPKIPYSAEDLTGDPQFNIVGDSIAHGPQGDVVRGLNFYRCVRSD